MADEAAQVFYASKPRILHVAFNIAIAPILLYLVGLWSWPPLLQHYIVFAITFMLAAQYAARRWRAPRLVLDDKGLFCGKFYPIDTIYRAEGSFRAVTLTVLSEGKVREKIISLGWASREDYSKIIALLTERFQREVPGSG